ncbi:RagB/SusD family nutrient uptake outer membrane protein [Ferruginibacter sp. HRS2-29]|uniref:RagB/SusD family nutrient uptake outer membrane protein n=1 Tax=Ferruginibacter sp. HRS2-29 TaxID=2487334 RepID=UPI0020CD2B0B|nr:RagB/SusD family nutrient uptake outer membrane protein [Ferruginibacter sp. HRS2-29]MCP9749399.1 RagB/SusD family nutrient uptake outer membrane protein [Ferruginibacter sp. HRS2-29]
MKKFKTSSLLIMTVIAFAFAGCDKFDINRLPETEIPDSQFWNSEADLTNACNRLYQELDGDWIDNRADDALTTAPNNVSTGNRAIPNTSGDWNDRYDEIFTANNILEKGLRAKVTEHVRSRWFAEAYFFRAYAYFKLLKLYGDVPLLLKTLNTESPELYMARTPRAEVVQQIYNDLDSGVKYLPRRADLPAALWGRVTRSSALAMKARVGLYEGTRGKFHGNVSNWRDHLNIAVAAATAVMGEGHTLFANYGNLFIQAGEGPANTENILVKIYGVSKDNLLLGHNHSRNMENGQLAPTRNLLRQYLYSDGLPAYNINGTTASATRSALFVQELNETSYNTILDNRDPRVGFSYFRAGEEAYQGPWVPKTSLGIRTAIAPKKGFNKIDQNITNAATVDRILIRYAEVLLTLAEAKFELNDAISDADLNLTVNALRTRVGFAPKLTNAFVTTNNLSMREEIRRERTVELAMEGFRYDDLIRWKLAETVLPQTLLGAKFITAEWVGTNQNTLNLNADRVLVVETAANRTFRVDRDYLYPVPLNEINTSRGNVIQNPNW